MVDEPTVPPEKWITHPVSDHADYLDRPGPVYASDLKGEARAEFEAHDVEPPVDAAKESVGGTPGTTKKNRRRRRKKPTQEG